MTRARLLALVAVAFAACGDLEACAVDRWDPPIAPEPSAYGPCGAAWVSCRPVARTCCPQGFVCPAAADGVCEDVGHLGGAVDGGTARPMRSE